MSLSYTSELKLHILLVQVDTKDILLKFGNNPLVVDPVVDPN